MLYIFLTVLVIIGTCLFLLFFGIGLIQHIFGKINFKAIFITIGVIIVIIIAGLIFVANKVLDIGREDTIKDFVASAVEKGDKDLLNEAYSNPSLKMSCSDKKTIIRIFMNPRKPDTGAGAMAQYLIENGASKKQIKEEVKYTYDNLQRIECSDKYKSVISPYSY